VAEIYKDDLNDSEAWRADVSGVYCGTIPAIGWPDDARQAILENSQEAQAEKAGEAQPVGETSAIAEIWRGGVRKRLRRVKARARL